MSDAAAPQRRSSYHLEDAEVQGLAANALGVLAAAELTPASASGLDPLFTLTDAYLAPEDGLRDSLLDRILAAGVPPTEVVDKVVPATARYIGKLWGEDRLSFAEVSIGSARLQETVRALGPRPFGVDSGPAVLLIIPDGETHTLGLYVLAAQFRRLGCVVEVISGTPAALIPGRARNTDYDLIGITGGSRRTLPLIRDAIRCLRRKYKKKTPIVVGGAIAALDIDLPHETGADHVCSDALNTLAKCNIELPAKKARLR